MSDLEPPNQSTNSSQDEDAYDELVVSIEASEGVFSLLIAVCDDCTTRERIIQRYEQELAPEILSYRLTLDWQEPSLRAAIGEWVDTHPEVVQQNRRVVLSVTGADELLWVNLRSDDPDKPPLEKFLGYLQWTREAIGQFRYPIVLWVTNHVLKLISRKAPDFWSWRRGVFRFSSEEVPNLVPQDLFSPESLTTLQSFELNSAHDDDSPLALEDLQDLIAKTEEQQGAKSLMLATLYDRLAEVYRKRVEEGEATDLLAERRLVANYFAKAIRLQELFGLNAARINTLNSLGIFYQTQGRFSEAIQCHQQALELARLVGDYQGEAYILGNLGNAYRSLGQYSRAIEFHQQALKIAKENADLEWEASSLGNLGITYELLGEFLQASECYQQSLEIQRQRTDLKNEANTLGNLGNVYYSLKQYSQAIDFFQQSLKLAQQLENRRIEAASLSNLGSTYYSLEQYSQAIEFYERSIKIKHQIGDRQGEAQSLGNLGNVYSAIGQYPKAIELYRQNLEIAQQIGDVRSEAVAWFNLGLVWEKTSQLEEAYFAFKEARSHYEKMNLEAMVRNCDEAIAHLEQAAGGAIAETGRPPNS